MTLLDLIQSRKRKQWEEKDLRKTCLNKTPWIYEQNEENNYNHRIRNPVSSPSFPRQCLKKKRKLKMKLPSNRTTIRSSRIDNKTSIPNLDLARRRTRNHFNLTLFFKIQRSQDCRIFFVIFWFLWNKTRTKNTNSYHFYFF